MADFNELLQKGFAGDITAAEKIGEGYLHGNGCELDLEKAFLWSEKAAIGESARAMTNLGILYMEGKLFPPDFKKAEAYFKHASENGDMKAPRYIGLMYRNEEIASDMPDAEAMIWFEVGAERGDITSQFYLGESYENGLGVEKDMDTAIEWYKKSAARGDKIAKPAMDALARLGVE